MPLQHDRVRSELWHYIQCTDIGAKGAAHEDNEWSEVDCVVEWSDHAHLWERYIRGNNCSHTLEGPTLEWEYTSAVSGGRLCKYGKRWKINASILDHSLSFNNCFYDFISFFLGASTRNVEWLQTFGKFIHNRHIAHLNSWCETWLNGASNQRMDLEPACMIANNCWWVSWAPFWHARISNWLILAHLLLCLAPQVFFIMIDSFRRNLRIRHQCEKADSRLQVHSNLVDHLYAHLTAACDRCSFLFSEHQDVKPYKKTYTSEWQENYPRNHHCYCTWV